MRKRMGILLGIGASSAVILACCWIAVGMIRADVSRLLTLEQALWVISDSDSGTGVTLYPPGSRASRQLIDLIGSDQVAQMRFSCPIVYCGASSADAMDTDTCLLISTDYGCVGVGGHYFVAPAGIKL